MTLTYYAIEVQYDDAGRWVEHIRYSTIEEARTNCPDAERYPEGTKARVVKVTKEVV